MRECRYQGECEHENHNPCYPVDDVVCKGYQPMPDVEALLKLASEIDQTAEFQSKIQEDRFDPYTHEWLVKIRSYSDRIREAVGA